MQRSSLFQTHRGRVNRLSKAAVLCDELNHIDAVSRGQALLTVQVSRLWDGWFEGEGVTADFMSSADKPLAQQRDESL